MKVYKIRNKTTGKFSSGGSEPKWTHQGKTWTRLGYLHSHLSCLHEIDFYKDSEIVEAEITENLVTIGIPNDYLIELLDFKIQRLEEKIEKRPGDIWYKNSLQNLRGRRALLNE